MRVEPYLMLAGRADEAIAFYQSAINAKVVMVMRFDDSPEPHQMPLPPNWGKKVMHSGITLGETLVMLSDGMSAEATKFSGVSLSITADSEQQATAMFKALSKGGSVFMPMGKTFWSPCFGMCTDMFGVSWMIGLDGPQG